jgi:hypothetical protein
MCYKSNNAFQNSEGLLFELRSLNFIALSRKMQMFCQMYVIHKVSRRKHGEYTCYFELAAVGPLQLDYTSFMCPPTLCHQPT